MSADDVYAILFAVVHGGIGALVNRFTHDSITTKRRWTPALNSPECVDASTEVPVRGLREPATTVIRP